SHRAVRPDGHAVSIVRWAISKGARLEDLLSLLGRHWAMAALCARCQATHRAAPLRTGGTGLLERIAEPDARRDTAGKIVVFATAIVAVLQQMLRNIDQVGAFHGQRRCCPVAQGVGETDSLNTAAVRLVITP